MADVTGVSRSTVDLGRKEKETCTFLSPKKIAERWLYKSIGGFDQAAIFPNHTHLLFLTRLP